MCIKKEIKELLELSEEEVEAKIQSGEMEKIDYPFKLYFLHHDREYIDDELIEFIADYLRIYTMREFFERFDLYIKYAIAQRFDGYNEDDLNEMFDIIGSNFMVTVRIGGDR